VPLLQGFSVRTWRIFYPSVVAVSTSASDTAAAAAAATANAEPWTIAVRSSAGTATVVVPTPTPAGGWPVLVYDTEVATAAASGNNAPAQSLDVMLAVHQPVCLYQALPPNRDFVLTICSCSQGKLPLPVTTAMIVSLEFRAAHSASPANLPPPPYPLQFTFPGLPGLHIDSGYLWRPGLDCLPLKQLMPSRMPEAGGPVVALRRWFLTT
jgi:hypothetical protein